MIGKERAKEIMKAFARQNLLVVGDIILDRYVSGKVNRISPEAPVPVVQVTGERALPGGAANVALNVQSLGGQAIVAGLLGQDQASEELIAILSTYGISTEGVVTDHAVTTTVKTRIMAERQQVVRVDREGPSLVSSTVIQDLCRQIDNLVNDVTGVIIEDYGKGAVSQETVDATLSAVGSRKVPVGFDPKENHELNISRITLATPNYREARTVAGLPDMSLSDLPGEDRNLTETGDILMKKWLPDLLIVTLGPRGMYVLARDAEPQIIPAKAREVFDVSGAGDTVIATALLSLAAGASYYEASSLANVAAGIVVGKVGTATCTQAEMIASLE